jgi:MYXO-CTERM domain-containing protein
MRNATFLAALLPALAQAQVKPRIIFDVDTSGSMAWEACDPSTAGDVDHANDCPGIDVPCIQCNADGCGDGLPNDGRLWKVKNAMSQVVTAFGEVDFALARFHGSPVTFGCKGGGWVGANAACFGAPLGMGDNAADILVPFGDNNQTDMLEWMDLQSNTPGPPSDTGCSLCPTCGGGCDKELRPTGATPVAGSIYSCNQYLDTVRSADPEAGCRPYGLIVLSDGQNNCADPATPTDPDPTPEQAAAVCADGIPVHVIGFASPTIANLLDAIADAGCGPACDDPDNDGVPNCLQTAILVDDETQLALAFADIIQGSIRVELCNGLDDDCDGLTDEDFVTLGSQCGKGRCSGTICCTSPTTVGCCAPNPTCETCNRVDDDCDGILDNNLDLDCNGMVDVPQLPCECYPEECNGIDDDCDCPGDTNSDGTSCGPGDVNVDEEPLLTSGYPCGTDVGACVSGLTCCMNSTPSCCGETAPLQELCNCIDDDCNGATDEGGFTDCFTLGDGCDPGTGICKGICQLGKSECRDTDPGPGCVAGAGDCLGERGPDTELCNCIDDNCDGSTDEDVVCAGGGRCENCTCPTDCDPLVEFPCPLGFNCECGVTGDCDCGAGAATDPGCADNWFCQVDVCLGVVCSDACQYCDPDSGGTCQPLCGSGLIVCQSWEECVCNTCVDVSCTGTTGTKCDENEVCNPITHLCEADPCVTAGCGDGEYCRTDGECGEGDAVCVPACPECGDDERCVCGQCVADPCANSACAQTQACCDGKCISNPCLALGCPGPDCECGTGQVCNKCTGGCEVDTCQQIECPGDTVCRGGECVPRRVAEGAGTIVSAAGAGGCSCRAGDAEAGGAWLVLLGLVTLIVRRRPCAW